MHLVHPSAAPRPHSITQAWEIYWHGIWRLFQKTKKKYVRKYIKCMICGSFVREDGKLRHSATQKCQTAKILANGDRFKAHYIRNRKTILQQRSEKKQCQYCNKIYSRGDKARHEKSNSCMSSKSPNGR